MLQVFLKGVIPLCVILASWQLVLLQGITDG